MSRSISFLLNIVDKTNKIIEYMLALFLAIMSCAIFWQVFSRYIVGSSTSWSEELARVLMVFIVLLGSAVALRKGQMLSVEVLSELIDDTKKRYLSIVVNAFSIIFYFVLFYYGYLLAEKVSGQTLPGLGISIFWLYVALPAGGFFLIVNAVANILENIKEVKK
ncbi:TRAP transporter small permease [Anaerobacillus sp. MEB173]|uniref:TRAP transporter small permease n=1 Tax=Anaerobacillus sp. MEB173 TaxID=3383345 RepID=UPI003F938D36